MKIPSIAKWPLAAAAATLLAAAPARAQIDRSGPYVVASVGASSYDYDCYFFSSCDHAHATVFRLGGGYRFGVFALEGWLSDFGGANLPWQQSLRVRGAGIGGAWVMQFSPTVHGLIRGGIAQMRQTRTHEIASSAIEPTFGLALLVDLTPTLALETSYDATTSTGDNSGSVLAQGLSIGLRLRF